MLHTEDQLDPNLKPLSEVTNYEVEKGDPDPRGYIVIGPEGRQIGRVDDLIIDTAAMKVRYLLVSKSETEGHTSQTAECILLPIQDVDVRSSSQQVVAARFTGSERNWTRTSSQTDNDRARLTRSEEELQVGKREVAAGEARIVKHVKTEHVSQPVTKRHEEVRRGRLAELAAHYREAGPPRGEAVVVIGPPDPAATMAVPDIDARLGSLLVQHSLRDAVAILAAETGLARRGLYEQALAMQKRAAER